MTQQEFNAKATELIKAMVNAIADKDFSRLATSIPPKLSWAHQIDAEERSAVTQVPMFCPIMIGMAQE